MMSKAKWFLFGAGSMLILAGCATLFATTQSRSFSARDRPGRFQESCSSWLEPVPHAGIPVSRTPFWVMKNNSPSVSLCVCGYVGRWRIHVLTRFHIPTAVIGMAHGAMIGPVDAGFGAYLRGIGYRILAFARIRGQGELTDV